MTTDTQILAQYGFTFAQGADVIAKPVCQRSAHEQEFIAAIVAHWNSAPTPVQTVHEFMGKQDPAIDLLAGLGFEREVVGGGATLMAYYGKPGEEQPYIWASCTDGGGMPTMADWHVCLYPADGSDPVLTLRSDEQKVNLETAVTMALAALPRFTVAPTDPIDGEGPARGTVQFEFPDFDNMEAFNAFIAAGWKDTSWHNDVCPSVEKDSLHMWIQHRNPAHRESVMEMFASDRLDKDGSMIDCTTVEYATLREALAAPTVETTEMLTDEYSAWLNHSGYAGGCASELVAELQAFAEHTVGERRRVLDLDIAFLRSFSARWDAAQECEDFQSAMDARGER